jgi:hypothetical protein
VLCFDGQLFVFVAKRGAMDLLPLLREAVDSGHVMSLFVSNQANAALRVVDFSHDPPKNDFQHNTYRVMLHDAVPTVAKNMLVCVFPGHSNKSKRFLQLESYGGDRDGFNKELNERFLATPEWDETYKDKRFLVLYGAHTYLCKGITGSIYIVWAEYVTRINAGNTASIPHKHVPIILNCNRKYGIKSMYILRPAIDNKPNELSLMPRAPGNPRLLYDTRYSPFVCEMRPDGVAQKRVQTVSKQEAYAMVTQSTRDPSEWLHFEQVPFTRIDVGDQGMLEIETSVQSSWSESPREMFVDSEWKATLIKEGTAKGGAQRPPQLEIRGGGVDEPDPFEDTVDEEMTSGSRSTVSRGVEIELEDL